MGRSEITGEFIVGLRMENQWLRREYRRHQRIAVAVIVAAIIFLNSAFAQAGTVTNRATATVRVAGIRVKFANQNAQLPDSKDRLPVSAEAKNTAEDGWEIVHQRIPPAKLGKEVPLRDLSTKKEQLTVRELHGDKEHFPTIKPTPDPQSSNAPKPADDENKRLVRRSDDVRENSDAYQAEAIAAAFEVAEKKIGILNHRARLCA